MTSYKNKKRGSSSFPDRKDEEEKADECRLDSDLWENLRRCFSTPDSLSRGRWVKSDSCYRTSQPGGRGDRAGVTAGRDENTAWAEDSGGDGGRPGMLVTFQQCETGQLIPGGSWREALVWHGWWFGELFRSGRCSDPIVFFYYDFVWIVTLLMLKS